MLYSLNGCILRNVLWKKILKHKVALMIVLAIVFTSRFTIMYLNKWHSNNKMEVWLRCTYGEKQENTRNIISARLEDIETTKVQENSIFFIETACKDDLNSRQACSVESTARYNKHQQIYVTMPSQGANLGPTGGEYIQMLSFNFPNVHIHRINISSLAATTKLKNWVETHEIKKSNPGYRYSHWSDALRFLILNVYGGTYIDLDFVIMRPLKGMINFAAEESKSTLSAGILSVEKNNPLAEAFLQEFSESFVGSEWGHNGPNLVQRMLEKHCDHQVGSDLWNNCPGGFKVYPPEMFYRIPFEDWRKLFDEKNSNDTLKLLEKSVGVHLWNRLSSKEIIRVGSYQPYAKIAELHCPIAYRMSGDYF